MESIFTTGLAIAFVYFILKFIELRYIIKQPKAIKELIRDSIIVYVSSIIGLYTIEQFADTIIGSKTPPAMTGNPEF